MSEQINPVDAGQQADVAATNINDGNPAESAKTAGVDAGQPQETEKEGAKRQQSAEENARYAAIRREAEQRARDAVIAELYGEAYGIKTYAEFKKFLQEQEEKNKIGSLVEKNIPEEVARELLELKKFKEEYLDNQRKQREYAAFLEAYPDVRADQIPAEVWAEFNSGKSLVDAYAKYENKRLREKLAELEKMKAAEGKNKSNAEAATGSITGGGSSNERLYTLEELQKMSVEEVKKNYSRVMESWRKLRQKGG